MLREIKICLSKVIQLKKDLNNKMYIISGFKNIVHVLAPQIKKDKLINNKMEKLTTSYNWELDPNQPSYFSIFYV